MYVALLLFEERDEHLDFLGGTVPYLDLVLRPAAAHLHRATVHPQTTNHALELVVRVVCSQRHTPRLLVIGLFIKYLLNDLPSVL